MNKYKNIEVLSPAGKYESFIAAVENGADAVYIGGSDFSARKNAGNFTNEDILNAVNYAHIRGVKVYIAVNTILFDSELAGAYNFINFCYNAGVDALIVQDLGVVSMVQKYFPGFKIHASTQMTIHNLNGVKMAEKLGFDRVVLSRELSYKEIKYICENTDIEIEVFVHGALCMCYSGQCLFSSILGSRSGNRGQCAQPCRLPYTLYDDKLNRISDENKYLLSLKDLCLIDEISALAKCGVKSLKIEGRMKSKEYVAIVTGIFNKYRNGGNVSKTDLNTLREIFSRDGFTKGYFEDDIGRSMLNYSRNNDDVYLGIGQEILKDARESSRENTKKIPIHGSVSIKYGEEIKIQLSDDIGNTINYTGTKAAEKSVSVPLSVERVKSQIGKLGNTPFDFVTLTFDIDDNINLPISELNSARREAVKMLEEKRMENTIEKITPPDFDLIIERKDSIHSGFTGEVQNIHQAKVLIDLGFERVYIPLCIYAQNKDFIDGYKDIFVVKLPLIMRDNYTFDYKNIATDTVCISNISQVNLFAKKRLHADYGMNISNSISVKSLKNMGVESVCLSPELNLKQIESISRDIDTEIIIYGRLPLMTVQNCIIKSAAAKCTCNTNHYQLCDRKNIYFPVKVDKQTCTNTIYNSTPTVMSDRLHEINPLNINFLKFLFTTETKEEVEEVISLYDKKEKYTGTFTRGHFYKGVL